MRFFKVILTLMILGGGIYMGCSQKESVIKDYADINFVKGEIHKLAPVEIKYDKNLLKPSQQEALLNLVRAASKMDTIFLHQVYDKNQSIKEALMTGTDPNYPTLLEYFNICFGPFDRLDHNKPFINLNQPKPAGANFYPEDMTKAEFDAWIKDHPEDEEAFTSNYTIIRRRDNKLVAIPYSEAYRKNLEIAGAYLRKAADTLQDPSLKKFLNSRAEAFLSNDYYQSDMDWMDLKDNAIEVVIGPYEVYEDELFGYKASFEAFVTLVDPAESEKLRKVNKYLQAMEMNLPIPDKYKNTRRGSSSPIVVVQEVFTAGDTKAGIQTTAFNLPNDERVREAKGSKKVMLKNIAEAKFQKCWIPIVNEVMAPEDLRYVSFEAYFNHTLMHEISHGLGPGIITVNGKETTVSKELQETYSTIEEAKADILGIYNTQFLIDKKFLPKSMERQTYDSYLGGIFRSVRFGINEAHGGANAIEYNYIKEKGGFVYDSTSQKFSVDMNKIQAAVRDLSHDLLVIEATGDYNGAQQFIKKYRYLAPEIQDALNRLQDVPIDIRPVYAVQKELK
ncbi:MAG: peptidase [Calditrichia bacterium]